MSRPTSLETVQWVGGVDGRLTLLDQTRLPLETVRLGCEDLDAVVEAIRSLRVRGAPAIGIAAAYGLVVGLRAAAGADAAAAMRRLDEAAQQLAASRPTAVNLFWALERCRRAAETARAAGGDAEAIRAAVLAEARAIHEEDRRMCRAIGRRGAPLLRDGWGVLTHCNAGGLATSEYGTALAVIFTAHEQGKRLHVYVDETRPLLQGARLTAWELLQHGVPATLQCDSAAAHLMRLGRIQAVITGADRIAANGDTANKIGTYGLAVLAQAHRIPFYVAAPSSTFDRELPDGQTIPIEQRPAEEVATCGGRRIAPEGVQVFNPAFDVTPASLIAAIITERDVIQPVSSERIAAALDGPPR